MSKKKASTVTVIFAIMLAAIEFGLLKLYPIGFAILTGVLAGFGFCELAKLFSSWLAEEQAEEPLSLPTITEETVDLGPEFTATYESIIAELEAENEKAT